MPVMDVEETLTLISDTCSTSEWSSIKFLCSNGLISNITMTSHHDHQTTHNGGLFCIRISYFTVIFALADEYHCPELNTNNNNFSMYVAM